MRAMIIGGGLVLILVVLAAVFGITYMTKYNRLVALQENVNEGRSKFAASVNICTQKMKSVWTLAEQEGILEKETYIGIAKARAGYEEARKEVEAAEKKEGTVLDLTKLGTNLGQSMLNVRIAFEAYPQLKTSETYQKAMTAVEEGYNEIKTALDDWISLCRNYNAYRRSFVTNFFAGTFFGNKFPERIAYYEGGIKEPEQLQVPSESINPRSDR